MPTRNVKSKGLFSFGTGVALGFGAGLALKSFIPKAIKMPGLILEKLGFEAADFLYMLWNPDDGLDPAPLPAPQARKRRKTVRAPRKAKLPERFAPSPLVSAAAIREAWRKLPASTRRASGLRLDEETAQGKGRPGRSAVRSVKTRQARGRVLAGAN